MWIGIEFLKEALYGSEIRMKRDDLWDVISEDTSTAAETSTLELNDSATTPEVIQHPAASTASASTASDTPRRKQIKAKSYIKISIQLELRVYIEDISDLRVAWKRLVSMYQSNTIADTMLVLKKWENICVTNQMGISTFITKVYKIQREMTAIG
uniref:Uncharacterized protein n=1 Tax=Physcomitrium patens TaxID=3218 RepID=A0A2K1IIL1_PHYPA|nr:hypothetical protein PHYPA_027804 [Physcomitrium patens]